MLGLPCGAPRDDAATEAATRHPGSKCSVRQGRLHGEVDSRHRDLVVLAHGRVGFVQQGRNLGKEPLPGQIQGSTGPIILTDHMSNPLAHSCVGEF